MSEMVFKAKAQLEEMAKQHMSPMRQYMRFQITSLCQNRKQGMKSVAGSSPFQT
jgi:hypothetical protein